MKPMSNEFDVVVVGFGAAGACAAIEAADSGAKVLVLDRFEGGGASKKSGGSFYAGGGTEIQKAHGFDDNPEQMFRYLMTETARAVPESTLRTFCQESQQNLKWLASHGIEFHGKFFHQKTTHPPDGYSLYFSGNEQQRATDTRPAPRGHVPKGEGMTGIVIFEQLKKAAVARGVEIRYHSQTTRLLISESGMVKGIEVMTLRNTPLLIGTHRLLGKIVTVSRALSPFLRTFEQISGQVYPVRSRAVVIAAGGFVFNPGMMKTYAPPYSSCMPLGTPGDDGSGIHLGQSAGGALARMNECAAWRFIYPPEAFVSGILINNQGERFCDESLYGATLCKHISEQKDSRATLIIDEQVRRLIIEQLAQGDRISDYSWGKIFSGELNALIFSKYCSLLNLYINRHRANSIAVLERKCRLSSGALQRTIENYNRSIVQGEVDEFGKADRYRLPLSAPPFLAINCNLDNQLFLGPCITLGGLKTDGLTAEVLREDGSPIPGLYAAGRSAAGICAGGYVSGLSLADCVFSGRRAGRHAAQVGTRHSR